MKGEKQETKLKSTSQTQLQTSSQILITKNLHSFLTKDKHFNASTNRTMSHIHLRQSNPLIHIAERAAYTSKHKSHQVDQKHQSYKKTTTLGRSIKRQPFPAPPLVHHSASSLPKNSDLLSF